MQRDVDDLQLYSRLIYKTAAQLEPLVEMDHEDIAQVLAIKVWKALRAFDPERCRTTRDRYVFMCLTDQKKDLLKKKRRGEVYIEDQTVKHLRDQGYDVASDNFHEQYLSQDHDEVYGSIDDDEVLIPSTLTHLERRVLVLIYTGDYKQGEMALILGVEKRYVERAVKQIRVKFADWRVTPAAEMERMAA